MQTQTAREAQSACRQLQQLSEIQIQYSTDACEDAYLTNLHIGVLHRTLRTKHTEHAVDRIYCRGSKRPRCARGGRKSSCFFY